MRRVRLASTWNVSFNMTAMIDVIFLLIIFFLCVSQYQKAESNEAVSLPDASSNHVRTPEQKDQSRLILNVLADGVIRVAGQDVSLDDLGQLLTQRQKATAPVPLEVWIRADRQAPYRIAEPILLACAQTGIWKVAFKVIREDEADGESP